jgi:hypothetical protein
MFSSAVPVPSAARSAIWRPRIGHNAQFTSSIPERQRAEMLAMIRHVEAP